MERSYLKLWRRYIAEAYQTHRFTEGEVYDVYDHAWGDWIAARFMSYDVAMDEYFFKILQAQNAGQVIGIPADYVDSDTRGGNV